jgi:uncharacterized protein YndB with AHSA1/START domain
MTWGGTTILHQPPAVVWDFLTSAENDVNWRRPWLEGITLLTEGPLRVGTRYDTLYRFFGRPERVIVEITELDPPRRMAWRQVESDRVASNVGSYDLVPLGDGRTRFTVTGSIHSHGWRRIVDAPFMWYLCHGPVQQQHAQLAAALGRRDVAHSNNGLAQGGAEAAASDGS